MATNEEIRKFQTLSARRKQVLKYVCRGVTYYEISKALFITEGAVRTTIYHVYRHLDLLSFDSEERLIILRDTYCPLFSQQLPDVNLEDTGELEPIRALVALDSDAEKVMDEDQKALVKVFGTGLEKIQDRQKGGSRSFVFRAMRLLLFVGAIAAASVFTWERFSGSGNNFSGQAEATQLAELLTSQSSELSALQTSNASVELTQEVAALSTSIPSATETATSSSTELPTITATPSSTPTQRPSPTADFGPIYEVGEWHVEGDVWYRLFDYEIIGTDIGFIIEIWNQGQSDILFNWSPEQNTSLIDNQGNKYGLSYWSRGFDYDEIISSQSKVIFERNKKFTVQFDNDQIFLPSVTEVYLTLEYFSRIEKATWVIYIPK